METYGAPHVMQEELKDFEHDWESHLLLREADAKGVAATPMAAPAGCLDAVPDVPAMREEDEQLLLPDTTWPFTGPRWSDTDNAVSDMANKLFNDYTYGVFQPFCSGAIEYDSDFDPSPLSSLLPGARALHTGHSRPLEAGSGFSHILHRGPSPVSDRASPSASQRRSTSRAVGRSSGSDWVISMARARTPSSSGSFRVLPSSSNLRQCRGPTPVTMVRSTMPCE